MREIDGDPSEQTVADHYPADLELAVVRGSFISESPPGYDAASHLEYEQGDRIRKEDVTLAEFGAATNLALLGGRSLVPKYGASLGDLDRSEEECVREFGAGINFRDNFHPEDFETAETDDGEQNIERGDDGQFAGTA